jgi:hypothetical protein
MSVECTKRKTRTFAAQQHCAQRAKRGAKEGQEGKEEGKEAREAA